MEGLLTQLKVELCAELSEDLINIQTNRLEMAFDEQVSALSDLKLRSEFGASYTGGKRRIFANLITDDHQSPQNPKPSSKSRRRDVFTN
ncbi:Hypothetical predicted protein [Pelobates cultripes]|uniref:Uncharacterized protein n=1 Tax=Pelobates cultripes TaxID=61616 RepID=A0AAD1VY38_PELCU|nr:Hypothetical predicted protein [Pelobates cultripes]